MNSALLSLFYAKQTALWAVPLLMIVCALVLYRLMRVQKNMKLLAGSFAHTLVQHYSQMKQYIKAALCMLGAVSLMLALLRPQWGEREEKVVQEGRDVFIALDISKSMLATDCVPNRLLCAKQKIKELVAALVCERVGLLLFAGSAFIQCPLTTDQRAFSLFLDAVDAQTSSGGTTAIDQALITMIASFKRMEGKKNKLLVLLTDGEDFSQNLHTVKEQAKREGIQIFALGVGTTQGAPIPLYNDQGNTMGHQKDAQGTVVISKLDEQKLQALVTDIGGMYMPMTTDMTDVRAIITQVHRYEKEQYEDVSISQKIERYHYFVGVSLVCFALEWLL
ncbi:MAG TPA: VWA domain-containing protein [Candidatus Bathyarchaeia archaeon]|nr:VWA domain-containing protein [Candidatus Bathyarchaeia archaeon]